MPKTFTRLSEDERYQVYEDITEKRSHRELAVLFNKHLQTVFNEVNGKRRLKSGLRVSLGIGH